MYPPTIHVIFRTCDVVNAVNKQPRPFDLTKFELIKICFKSLYNAIQKIPHTITILGDKVSPELQLFFKNYNVFFSNGDYGNDESIRQSIHKALSFTNNNDWVYFCEDDYLHKKEAFTFILNAILDKENIFPRNEKRNIFDFSYKKVKPNIVIFPNDYPDRYSPLDRTQHFIFHTNDCHWRQVANTTFTFIMQVKDVKKYKDVLLKSSINANDGYLSNTLFGIKNFKNKLLCIAPIPSLTAHMHINTLPPLVDWQKIMYENSNEIGL